MDSPSEISAIVDELISAINENRDADINEHLTTLTTVSTLKLATSKEQERILNALYDCLTRYSQNHLLSDRAYKALNEIEQKITFLPIEFQRPFFVTKGNSHFYLREYHLAAKTYTQALWIKEDLKIEECLLRVEAAALVNLFIEYTKNCEDKVDAILKKLFEHLKSFNSTKTGLSEWLRELTLIYEEVECLALKSENLSSIHKELSEFEIQHTQIEYKECCEQIRSMRIMLESKIRELSRPYYQKLQKFFILINPLLNIIKDQKSFDVLTKIYQDLKPWLNEYQQELMSAFNYAVREKRFDIFDAFYEKLNTLSIEWINHRQYDYVRECYQLILKRDHEINDRYSKDLIKRIKEINDNKSLIRASTSELKDEVKSVEKRESTHELSTPRKELNEWRQELVSVLEQKPQQLVNAQIKFTDCIKKLIKTLIQETETLLSPTAFDFCIVCMGSMTRCEFNLGSDLDLAIIVSEEAAEKDPYFIQMKQMLEIKLACLGELGGLMLDSDHFSICTVKGFSEKYHPDNETKLVESYAFHRIELVHANTHGKKLLDDYQKILATQLQLTKPSDASEYKGDYKNSDAPQSPTKTDPELSFQKFGLRYLLEHKKSFDQQTKQDSLEINIKQRYLQPLTLWCTDIALFYGLLDENNILLNTVPKILARLEKDKKISPFFADELLKAWDFLQQLRTHQHAIWRQYRWHPLVKRDMFYNAVSEEKTLPGKFILTADQKIRLERIDQWVLQPMYQVLTLNWHTPSEPLDPIIYIAKQRIKTLSPHSPEIQEALNNVIDLFGYRKTSSAVQCTFYQTLPDSLKNYYYETSTHHEAKQLATQLNTLVADYAEIPLHSLTEPLTPFWSISSGSHLTTHLLQTLGACPLQDGSRPYYTESVQTWQETLKTLIEPLSTQDKQNEKLPDRWLLQWIDSEGVIVTGILKQAIQTNWRKQGYLDEKDNLTPKEKWPKEKHEGRSRVMRIMIGDVTVAYAKCYPELPGVQVLAESLAWRLSGASPLSTLVVCTNPITGERYPILFSQNAGETLQAIFEQEGSLNRVEKTLDPYGFTWKFFETLLLLYEDDKLDNQALQFFYNRQGKYRSRLISFDSDRAFVKPVLDEKSYGKRTLKVNAKSIVFCLPQMNELLNEDAVREMINLEPEALLKGWLTLAAKYNRAFAEQDPFHLTELQKWAKQESDSSHLPAFLLPNTVKRLYQTFRRMQRALKENSKQTHFELFRSIEPFLASFYEEAFENPEGTSTTKRFKHLPTEYVILESEIKETKQESTAGDEKKTIVSSGRKSVQVQKDQFKCERSFRTITTVDGHEIKSIKKAIQQILKNKMGTTSREQNYELKQALDELKMIHQHYHEISHLRAELLQGKTGNFKSLTEANYLKERIVDHIFLDTKPQPSLSIENLQKLILEAIPTSSYQELYFTGCHTLTDKLLLPILKSSPNLRVLDVSGCTLLTDNTVINVAYYCPRLKKLSLTGLTKLKKLTTFKVFSYGTIDFPKLKRLLLDNCSGLTHLAIEAPQLETISICNSQALTFVDIQGIDEINIPEWNPQQILQECLAAAPKEFIPYLEQQRLLLPFLISGTTKKNLILTRKHFLEDLIERWLSSRIALLRQENKLKRSPADVEHAFWQTAEAFAWDQLMERKFSRHAIKGNSEIKAQSKDTQKNHSPSPLSKVEHAVLLEPLLSGSKNHFFHQLLQRYFVVHYLCRVFKGDINFAREPFSSSSISPVELPIIEWLAELLVNDVKLQTQLFVMIEKSRTDPFAAPFAAYAISLLNCYNVPLVEKDFRDIRIPGANLRGALLQGTSFVGADLREVNFTDAYLRETDFRYADLSNNFISTIALLSSEVDACCYSADGRYLAVGSGKVIYLYEARTRIQLGILKGHASQVTSIAFHPDGSRIVSGSDDRTLRLWDTLECKALHTLEGHTSRITTVAFHPDGSQILSGSADRTLRLWDALEQKALHTFEGHTNWVTSVAFHPDGSRIVSASEDCTLRLWDITERKALHTFAGHTDWVTSVAFHPDGSRIVSASQDSTLRLWDIRERKALHTFEGHSDAVMSVAFHPDGSRIVSGSWDCTLCIWDTLEYKALHTFEEHTDHVTSVAFHPDGYRIVSRSWNGTLHLWDPRERKAFHTFEGHTRRVSSVAFHPDGSRIVSGSNDSTLRLWGIAERKALDTFEGDNDQFNSVAFHHDGSYIVSGSWDDTLGLWDVVERKTLHTFEGHTDSVTSVALSPDGSRIVSASMDCTLRLWDITERKALHTFKGHSDWVTSVAFNPDGSRIVSGSHDRTLRLWDVAERKALHTFEGHTSWVTSVAFHPDGSCIVSGSSDRTLRLWDLRERKALYTFEGHTDTVRSVAFNPEGTCLASGSEDQTVRVWNTETYQCLAIIKGFTGGVNSVAWAQTAEGLLLATGSSDNAVRYWRITLNPKSAHATLLFSSHPNQVLNTENMLIYGAKGLDEETIKLLKYYGAIDEPPLESKTASESKSDSKPSLENKNNAPTVRRVGVFAQHPAADVTPSEEKKNDPRSIHYQRKS